MRDRLRKDSYYLVVSLITFLCGLNFVINPDIMQDKSSYSFIVNVLDDKVFTYPMLTLGLLGTVAFFGGLIKFRSFFLVIYQFIWVILTLAYLWMAWSSSPNSTWIISSGLNVLIFLSAYWGDDYVW